MQNLIEDEAQGPNIALGSVFFAFKNLQRHIERSSYASTHYGTSAHLPGKTKIA
jgi:hypothetical protein